MENSSVVEQTNMDGKGIQLPHLPNEIWDIILDFKEKLEVPIPAKYIICKTINGQHKEQIATIDGRHMGHSQYVYEYNYGIFGFHEGFCTKDQIRNLTPEEQILLNERKSFSLPQQFYHSIPNYD